MLREFEKVEIDALPSWAELEPQLSEEQENGGTKEEEEEEATFPIRNDLNSKLYIWKGHILSIAVDAIVNTTNESLNEKAGVCGEITANGGQLLVNDMMSLEGCRTGEAKITRSHSLPHNKFVIHTVGPRYNVKYQTAAENALHSCYRNSLQLVVENKLTSIALPPINTPARGYPRDSAAHLALVTTRKFLEKFGETIRSIVFVVESDDDHALYRSIMRYYFPRSNSEVFEAKKNIPIEFYNTSEFGEKIIPEREIRISTPLLLHHSADYDLNVSHNQDDLNILELNSMEVHPDVAFASEKSKKTQKQLDDEEIDRIYSNYLKNTTSQDLAEIARMNIVYQSETDSKGRPIIVFVGANFPKSENIRSMKKLLAYIIRTLHVISSDFVVVYLHAGMTKKQQPDFAWIRLLYKIWERKFTQKMVNLYIVHPTFWVKFIFTLLKPFISQTFSNRVIHVTSLSTLFTSIPSSIKIPEVVYEHDRQQNNSNYVDNPKNEGL